MTFVDEPVTFTIEQEDIDNGLPRMSMACPAVHALRRMFPGLNVRVGSGWVHIGNAAWRTPEALSQFVLDFDSRRKVAPLTVTLVEQVPARFI